MKSALIGYELPDRSIIAIRFDSNHISNVLNFNEYICSSLMMHYYGKANRRTAYNFVSAYYTSGGIGKFKHIEIIPNKFGHDFVSNQLSVRYDTENFHANCERRGIVDKPESYKIEFTERGKFKYNKTHFYGENAVNQSIYSSGKKTNGVVPANLHEEYRNDFIDIEDMISYFVIKQNEFQYIYVKKHSDGEWYYLSHQDAVDKKARNILGFLLRNQILNHVACDCGNSKICIDNIKFTINTV